MFDLFIDLCPLGNEDKNQTKVLFKIRNLVNPLLLSSPGFAQCFFEKCFPFALGELEGIVVFPTIKCFLSSKTIFLLFEIIALSRNSDIRQEFGQICFALIYDMIVALLVQSNLF